MDESLLGFFHRLADVNGHPDGASLLGLVGWRYGRALIEALPVVEQSLGLAPGVLLPLAPIARPARGLLDRRFERMRSVAICPTCVADRRPHHLSWRHCLVTTCLTHGLVLQDTWPCWSRPPSTSSPRNRSSPPCVPALNHCPTPGGFEAPVKRGDHDDG